MSSPFPCVGSIIAKFIVAAMNQSGGETSGLIRWLSLALYGWKVIQSGPVLASRMRPIEPLIHTHSLRAALRRGPPRRVAHTIGAAIGHP